MGRRDVDADEIAAAQQFVHADEHDTLVVVLLFADVGIVGQHGHAETKAALGDNRADPPQPDQAERFAEQLCPGLALAIQQPVARFETAMRVDQVATERQHERNRQFASGNGIDAGGVHDDDAPAGGGFDIDPAQAGANAPDHAQKRARSRARRGR